MVSSFSMASLNSLVVAHLPIPLTIVSVQMAFTVASVGCSPSSLSWGSLEDIRRWGAVEPFLFLGSVASSAVALNYAPTGLMSFCRHAAPLASALIEAHFRNPFVLTAHTLGSMGVMLAGAAMYLSHDFNAWTKAGVAIASVNALFAVMDRVVQRHLIANIPVDISKTMMMLLNNGIAVLPCFLLALAAGEHTQWRAKLRRVNTQSVLLVLSCLNAAALCYLGIRLQHHVTATTFMVLTNMSKLVVVIFGAAFLGEATSALSMAGVLVSIAGSFYYVEARKRAEKAPRESDSKSAHYATVMQMAEL